MCNLNKIKIDRTLMNSNISHKFRISEIFYSIQGEGTRAGMPCIFIRLQGCKLRCVWCDTKYALKDKEFEMSLTGKEIKEIVKQYNCNYIQFTGGEPLEQREIIPLMTDFCNDNYIVSLETNGHEDIGMVDSRVIKIMDIKCPGSHMQQFNNYENLKYLNPNDEVKFVITDRDDFDWAINMVTENLLIERTAAVLFSPVFGVLAPELLSKWILDSHLNIRLQLQIHKFIWEPETRGV
jgi:7-carboxy-7-deazaguanine synthase